VIYAAAYSMTVLKRLMAEKPEFLEEAGVSEDEMVTHLTNNMCLPYQKYQSRMFRERSAELKEEDFLRNSIKRLYNHGDKFHPYI